MQIHSDGRSRILRMLGRQPEGGGQHTILQNFLKKLHEIEKILAHGLRARP